MIGAEDRLVSGLRVILNLHAGSEKLTNAEVVDAVKIIQQRTKRKNSSLDVFKFQDVSIFNLLLLTQGFIISFEKLYACNLRLHPGLLKTGSLYNAIQGI